MSSYYETPPPGEGQIVLPNNYEPNQVANAINEAPPKAHWTGSAGFIIAIVAIVLILAFIIIRLVFDSNNHNNNNCGNNGNNPGSWTVVNSSASTVTRTASNGLLFRNSASGTVSFTAAAPSSATGQAFIIDNSGPSTGTVVIAVSGQTTTPFSVAAGDSAQFVWVSQTALARYSFATNPA